MNLTKSAYQKLEGLALAANTRHSSGLFVQDDKLYKIFESTDYLTEKERNITYFQQHPLPNIPIIYDKIYIDEKFSGYVMSYLTPAKTFREAIAQNPPISIENKVAAISEVYATLKKLHAQNIYLGDIHSDNFLITEDGQGFIIDIEEVRFPEDEFKFKQLYLIKPNSTSHKINIASCYTDNAKLMITALSLLLNKDLEQYISATCHSIDLAYLYEREIKPLQNPNLDRYFTQLINHEMPAYFDNVLLDAINKTSSQDLAL